MRKKELSEVEIEIEIERVKIAIVWVGDQVRKKAVMTTRIPNQEKGPEEGDEEKEKEEVTRMMMILKALAVALKLMRQISKNSKILSQRSILDLQMQMDRRIPE